MSDRDKLIINVHAFSGNPDVYVNPKKIPEDRKDFAFNSTGSIDDRLVITSKDRLKAGAATGVYYICVYGNHTSSYRLRVNEKDEL